MPCHHAAQSGIKVCISLSLVLILFIRTNTTLYVCIPGSAGPSTSALMARLQAKAGAAPPAAEAMVQNPQKEPAAPLAKATTAVATPAAATAAAAQGLQKKQPIARPALAPLPGGVQNAPAIKPIHAAGPQTSHSTARGPLHPPAQHDATHAASGSHVRPTGTARMPDSASLGAKQAACPVQPLQESNRQLTVEAASSASPHSHLLDSQVSQIGCSQCV